MSAGTGRLRRGVRWLREVLLWVGALLGGLCLVSLVASFAFGLTALVFTSGSMAPTYQAGSLGIAREVPVDDLRVGDVVMVALPDGGHVTHRIVALEPQGERALLTLRGDANPVSDQTTYAVDHADRVLLGIPYAGFAVSWLTSPLGILVCGVLLAVLLFLAFGPPTRPEEDGPGKRKLLVGAAVVVLVGVGGAGLGGRAGLGGGALVPTQAAWTDRATATSGALTALTLSSPTRAATPCTANNGLFDGSVTLRWNGVASSTRPLANMDYELRFFNRSTGQQVGATQLQDHAGVAGAVQSYSSTGTLLGNLLGLNLLSSQSLQLRVRSHLKGTSWYGASTESINFSTASVLGFVTFTCGP